MSLTLFGVWFANYLSPFPFSVPEVNKTLAKSHKIFSFHVSKLTALNELPVKYSSQSDLESPEFRHGLILSQRSRSLAQTKRMADSGNEIE